MDEGEGKKENDIWQTHDAQSDTDNELLAMRTAAAFLFGNAGVRIVIIALLAILGGVRDTSEFLRLDLILYLIADIWIGINLWRGRTRWRSWALARAFAGFILLGLAALAEGLFLNFIIQAALGGSIILVLTGKSTRVRTLTAIAIYLIGYLGLSALSILIGLVVEMLGVL